MRGESINKHRELLKQHGSSIGGESISQAYIEYDTMTKGDEANKGQRTLQLFSEDAPLKAVEFTLSKDSVGLIP